MSETVGTSANSLKRTSTSIRHVAQVWSYSFRSRSRSSDVPEFVRNVGTSVVLYCRFSRSAMDTSYSWDAARPNSMNAVAFSPHPNLEVVQKTSPNEV